jgi:predicted metal-dependent phosphotriesterase family hydrolase
MKRASVIALVMFLVLSLAVVASAKPAEPVPDRPHQGVGNLKFFTTAGPLDKDEVGNVLAHHHMFVELNTIQPGNAPSADEVYVLDLLRPWVEDAIDLGAGVFVELTPQGVGQRADIVKYVADETGLPTMLVTGIYREPFMLEWTYDATVEEIADFMLEELKNGVGTTDVPAGFIKLSQNDTGMTLTERKVLEAACIAARKSGATIASHITAGPTALSVMDALEGFGCDPDKYRFVWIHAMMTAKADGAKLEGTWGFGYEPGWEYILEAAERGAYISLDGIGSGYWSDYYGGFDLNLGWINDLVAAGYEDQIIIGADTGWYDPGYPGDEVEWFAAQNYNSIFEFADWLAEPAQEVSDELIQKLMHGNPWNAYSRAPVHGN